MKKYYPILIDLKNKKCKVIGGGKVAERKVKSLIEHGADVEVISPHVTELLAGYFQQGSISLIKRQYQYGDLTDCDLVFAATDNEAVNEMCNKESCEKNLWINIIDHPNQSGFIIPASFRRGHLSISISTDGKSPVLAKQIKEALQEQFPHEYSEYTEALGQLRDTIKSEIKDLKLKKEMLNQLVDSDIFQKYMNKEIDNLEDALYIQYRKLKKEGAANDDE